MTQLALSDTVLNNRKLTMQRQSHMWLPWPMVHLDSSHIPTKTRILLWVKEQLMTKEVRMLNKLEENTVMRIAMIMHKRDSAKLKLHTHTLFFFFFFWSTCLLNNKM